MLVFLLDTTKHYYNSYTAKSQAKQSNLQKFFDSTKAFYCKNIEFFPKENKSAKKTLLYRLKVETYYTRKFRILLDKTVLL